VVDFNNDLKVFPYISMGDYDGDQKDFRVKSKPALISFVMVMVE
jgi:hypothetical protein